MNQIWKRQARKRRYRDPQTQLEKYGRIFDLLRESGLESEEMNARFRKKQARIEGFHAAAFCYGIQLAMEEHQVAFSMWESSDHDFVFRTGEEPQARYFPAQLKEFVPSSLNRGTTFQQILDKLPAYSDSEDLNLVIYYSREGKAGIIGELQEATSLRSLWVLGLVANNPARFVLAGDYMQPKQNRICFEYSLQPNQPLHTDLRPAARSSAGERQNR